jgi:hypothetical protein
MSDDELKAALPSMLFTTSNLIWSSEYPTIPAVVRTSRDAVYCELGLVAVLVHEHQHFHVAK